MLFIVALLFSWVLFQLGASKQLQEPTRLAAILIDSPMIAALNAKLMTDCASTALRMVLDIIAISDVCTATAIVNEKYAKSQ